MLELGQPMHAYDLGKLKGGLEARWARHEEKTTLLDGKEITLGADVLVIADANGPVGMAGVMGGLASSCTPETTDILFEAAFFTPSAVAGRGRRYGLVTDAGQRFERGVDPIHQERAVERATQLLLEIAGGKAGPTQVAQDSKALPKRLEVALRRARIARLLGTTIDDNEVKATLESLGMRVLANGEGWLVTPPPHRFDINIEADLIEELARIVGFESIPEADAATSPDACRVLPEEAPVGVAGAGDPGHARLPGSHHLRVRRSGAAGEAVPRRRDAAARQCDFKRNGRHARLTVAGAASRRRRRTSDASRIASACSSMARVSRPVASRPICWPVLPSARGDPSSGGPRRRRWISSM